MRFDAAKRTRLLVDTICDIDPTGSTVEVKVDDVWHAATWLGAAVLDGGKWTQTARTVDYFAGPDATAAGATVLPRARHRTKARVTKGGDVLVAESTPIDVK